MIPRQQVVELQTEMPILEADEVRDCTNVAWSIRPDSGFWPLPGNEDDRLGRFQMTGGSIYHPLPIGKIESPGPNDQASSSADRKVTEFPEIPWLYFRWPIGKLEGAGNN